MQPYEIYDSKSWISFDLLGQYALYQLHLDSNNLIFLLRLFSFNTCQQIKSYFFFVSHCIIFG